MGYTSHATRCKVTVREGKMSNVKMDNVNGRSVDNRNNRNRSNHQEDDWDDDDDLYTDYDQSRWSKGNQRKVLKFKEHKAK